MNLKIQTLTPVHVGSGNFLNYNTDFFSDVVKSATQTDGIRYLRVIDDKKILNLVGREHLQDWVLSIERGQNIKEFMKTYAPKATPSDYSQRRIQFFYEEPLAEKDTLKECIHNGMGMPYIPGSSIKGAFRTAIVATLANGHVSESSLQNKRGRFDGSVFEKQLLGSDPNHDIFRFFHCGDAYFKKGTEVAFLMQMYLNITHRNHLVPHEDIKPQFIEAIGADAVSDFALKLDADYYHWVKRVRPDAVGDMPNAMKELSALFQCVNAHTLLLINREIEFWSSQTKTGAEDYIEQMEDMRNHIKLLQAEGNHSCILRLGHAIGWDFVTGGWTRKTPCFERIVDEARPRNERYQEYDFPKSRRLDSDGEMIGFVKLSAT